MMDQPGPPGSEPPRAPRWVKVSAIVAAVVVALIIAITLLSGGEHGPGRHLPGGDHTAPLRHTTIEWR